MVAHKDAYINTYFLLKNSVRSLLLKGGFLNVLTKMMAQPTGLQHADCQMTNLYHPGYYCHNTP